MGSTWCIWRTGYCLVLSIPLNLIYKGSFKSLWKQILWKKKAWISKQFWYQNICLNSFEFHIPRALEVFLHVHFIVVPFSWASRPHPVILVTSTYLSQSGRRGAFPPIVGETEGSQESVPSDLRERWGTAHLFDTKDQGAFECLTS